MNRLRSWFSHAWIVLLVAGVVITLDQWTKSLVRANVPKLQYQPILGAYFGLEHVDNHGAAFGLFQDGRIVLTIIAVVVVTAILVYVAYIPREHRFVRVLLGLMVGGALGNLIDRLLQGYVTDFVKMGIPGLYFWPNWNVADSAIVIGTISLALYIIWDDNRTARAARLAERLPNHE